MYRVGPVSYLCRAVPTASPERNSRKGLATPFHFLRIINLIVTLTNEQIADVARILGARLELNGPDTLLYIGGGESSAPPVVMTVSSVAPGLTILSAQTVHGYFELHDLSRFVPVDPDEVIFVAEEGNRISGLVVGATGTCSLFANVARATISADFATLEPALLLAAMQLGLAENITA